VRRQLPRQRNADACAGSGDQGPPTVQLSRLPMVNPQCGAPPKQRSLLFRAERHKLCSQFPLYFLSSLKHASTALCRNPGCTTACTTAQGPGSFHARQIGISPPKESRIVLTRAWIAAMWRRRGERVPEACHEVISAAGRRKLGEDVAARIRSATATFSDARGRECSVLA